MTVALVALCALLSGGCRGNDDDASVAANAGRAPSFTRSAGGSYSGITVANPGTVSGTVTVGGTLPADTLVHPTSDMQVCGSELQDVSIDHDGPKLAGAVVWLDGVRSGKALPLVKRYDVINEGCLMTPRVQAAAVGGTLNVRSRDPIIHRTRIIRPGEKEPVALVTETDEGQVVPLDKALDRAGLLEIRCDLHPWTRAWLVVFDHPYFEVTGRDGAFSLDSVPPGEYTLHVWHERLGTITRPVKIESAGAAKVQLDLHFDGTGKR
ncbi:MAG TPA: carboxypeptidase regulatory-like domain-containing protein [Gemmatimonadaceae bacterium]